ncbi:MAG: phosphatase PAP2 family protein [Rubripirellula sp.]|nr:phosphatase PAP2 family protein [Rubripirellula sp.]
MPRSRFSQASKRPGFSILSRLPDRRHIAHTAFVAVAVSLWFMLVYGGCNWITSQHAYRFDLAVPGEKSLPFYPAASLIYLSIYPLFLFIPFMLPSIQEVNRLGLAVAVMIGIASIGFLLLPGRPISHPHVEGTWHGLFHVADVMNLSHNYLPSLHVGLAVSAVSAMNRNASFVTAGCFWTWAFLVAISTLVLHQHYLIDVVSGWILAVFCVRLFFNRGQGIRVPSGDLSPTPPA